MCPSADPGDSFTELLRPHLDRLYRLAYRLSGSPADAEDLVQDVLCRAFERRRELGSITELGPWLGRVLYNRFIDDTRKHARRRLSLIDPDQLDLSTGDCCDCPAHQAPDVQVDNEFSIIRLETALAKLSLDHRTVLLMHDVEGYKLNEIQRVTGISLGTLKSRLHRARARIRELLESDGTFSRAAAFKGRRNEDR